MLTNKLTFTILLTINIVLLLLTSCGSGNSSERNSAVIPQQPSTAVEQIILPITIPYSLVDEITPQQAIAEMAIGINLGNTLDAPNEGDWALPAQESFIIDFKEAGFNHVRIPVTWHEHTQLEAPYDIDSEFLARVEQIVDWALAQDLYVILNVHHESWLKENYQDQKNKNRLDSIWIKIAAHFKEKSAKLMF